MKVLAKDNTNMTDWVANNSDIPEEKVPEENLVEMRDEEIELEADQPNSWNTLEEVLEPGLQWKSMQPGGY